MVNTMCKLNKRKIISSLLSPLILQGPPGDAFYLPACLLKNCMSYLFVTDARLCGQAILYYSSRADMEATDGQESQQCRSHPLSSGLEVLGPVLPPFLVLPSEQYPSVLITDAKSSNAVTIR